VAELFTTFACHRLESGPDDISGAQVLPPPSQIQPGNSVFLSQPTLWTKRGKRRSALLISAALIAAVRDHQGSTIRRRRRQLGELAANKARVLVIEV
jgi:hypothetical protein